MLITGASVGLTVGTGVGVAVASLTVTGIFLTTPLTLTLTVAVPLPTNVMLPFSSTVATSSFDDVHVVLDDDDRVSALDQGVERREQFRDVVEVQPRRRLVEDEHDASLRRILRQERSQLHALALAAREGRRRLS